MLSCETLAGMQGIVGLVNRQERRCADTDAGRRQFLEVAGRVLLDAEMTVKLLSQGKVGIADVSCVMTLTHAIP